MPEYNAKGEGVVVCVKESKIESKMFTLSSERFSVGRYNLYQLSNGSLWMSNSFGEGMSVGIDKVEEMLAKFFEEEF